MNVLLLPSSLPPPLHVVNLTVALPEKAPKGTGPRTCAVSGKLLQLNVTIVSVHACNRPINMWRATGAVEPHQSPVCSDKCAI